MTRRSRTLEGRAQVAADYPSSRVDHYKCVWSGIVSGGTSGGHRNRDRLIKDLIKRVRAAMESGDPTGVLDAATLHLARDLAETFPQEAVVPDVIALGALVAVHWARYLVLPEGQGQDDLQACLKWSAALLPVAPQLVPEPVRTHLADADSPAGGSATEATARGADLYENYKRSGNIQLLQTAITLFGDAVGAAPVGHPDRPRYLYHLGIALRARYQRTGQRADLDQAITSFREAVGAAPAYDPARPVMLSNLGNTLYTLFGRKRSSCSRRSRRLGSELGAGSDLTQLAHRTHGRPNAKGRTPPPPRRHPSGTGRRGSPARGRDHQKLPRETRARPRYPMAHPGSSGSTRAR